MLSCTFCKDSFSLIHDVNCRIYITVPSVSTFTVINPFRKISPFTTFVVYDFLVTGWCVP